MQRDDPAWLAAVRELQQCVSCGTNECEPAHRNEGKGMGLKVYDWQTAALCRTCHRIVDTSPNLTREQRRAEADRLILATIGLLLEEGYLALTPKARNALRRQR